jgi:protein-tyrosine-phosphatase
LTKCPNCESKTIVWNISDPYFLSIKHAETIYRQIKAKVTELADSL